MASLLFISNLPFAQEKEAAQTGEYTVKEYLDEALPLNENRRIVLDEVTGMLTITDTPSNQQIARELIRLWDVGPHQVRIQARFVEVVLSDVEELGIEWWYRRIAHNYGKASDIDVSAFTEYLGDDALFGDATKTSGLNLAFGKISGYTGTYLLAYVKALEEQGKANLLSSPTVTTLSGQMANIQLANIFPYASDVERTNIGSPALPRFVEKYKVKEKAVGIVLEVTPKVAGESKIITMDIHPEVTVLIKQIPVSGATDFPAKLGYPVVDIRTTETSVVIKSGETVVIGGLIREDENVTKRKVPILGDIPLLGILFKSKYVDRTKKNLVIFLTATIVDSTGEPIL
ncbi:MAG: secretin N-terminal domain-containing protein [Candidatus Omnitrophota bacterium]